MPTAASVKQAAKRKAERHARGLMRPGRPRNDPDRLANAPTGRPVGRPRGLIKDDFTIGILSIMKAHKEDVKLARATGAPEPPPLCRPHVPLPGEEIWTMEQALEQYREYLKMLKKETTWLPDGPPAPPRCMNYHVGSLEELMEYHAAKIHMEREFFPKVGSMPYWLREAAPSDDEADWDPPPAPPAPESDDEPHPEASSSAQPAPPQPAQPVPPKPPAEDFDLEHEMEGVIEIPIQAAEEAPAKPAPPQEPVIPMPMAG
jgi:hypothetical protein